MLFMLFSGALTTVLLALFSSSVGRAKPSHTMAVGILGVVSLLWLIHSFIQISNVAAGG